MAKHGNLVPYIYKRQIALFVKWQMPFLLLRPIPKRKRK